MPLSDHLVVRLAIALSIGLLIGAERERRKGSGPSREPAGIRTFALTSLVGALSVTVGGNVLLMVGVAAVATLSIVAYRVGSEHDPGLTTEIALLATVLLGALAVTQPSLAAGVAVGVTVLLAVRTPLHRFVRDKLSEREVQDGLLFAAAALVILPLTPDHPVGPLGVLNLRTLWKLAVIVMAISAAGYIAVRAFGPRFGLPLAGLASGFVSSAATIGSMASRASEEPKLRRAAVAGAVLSTLSTIILMAVVLLVTHRPTFWAMRFSLLFAGLAAAIYGALFTIKTASEKPQSESQETGRAFNLTSAVVFAATVSAILVASAAMNRWLGSAGLVVATGIAGFADAHSAAISVASLASAEKISAPDGVLSIMVGLTTNTITKALIAMTAGGRGFALEIIPGLLVVILSAWAGLMLGS